MTYAGRQLLKRFPHSFIFLLFTLTTGASVVGQSTATDGYTPSALTPGAPAGSYALSDFENINFYNGSFNFHLPLRQVQGRGGAGYTMMLPLEQHWRVEHWFGANIPLYNWWIGIKPGYGPGVLQARQVSEMCTGTLGEIRQSLTKLTFTATDGTEYELH